MYVLVQNYHDSDADREQESCGISGTGTEQVKAGFSNPFAYDENKV